MAPEDVARIAPILDEVAALVAEIVTLGLRRAGRVTIERLRRTMAMAASVRPRSGAPREAGLGRITRSLERLSDLLPSLEGPDTALSGEKALAEVAALRDLVRALRANTGHLPLADMAGATRSEYVELATLEVQGLGLEAWVGPGGTLGLSAYVAVLGGGLGRRAPNGDPEPQAMNGARTLVRSVLTKGQTTRDLRAWAERAAAGPAFAHGSVTLRDLAHGRFALSGARFAPATGRLSGSSTTSAAAKPLLPLDDEALRPFVLTNAEDAARLGRALAFDPLGRPQATRAVVLLPVRGFSPSDFDASTQRLSLRIRTAGGATLATSLPFREDHALYFDNLEVLSRAARPPSWLSVRLGRDGGELLVEPIMAILPELGPLDLSIDRLGPELEGP